MHETLAIDKLQKNHESFHTQQIQINSILRDDLDYLREQTNNIWKILNPRNENMLEYCMHKESQKIELKLVFPDEILHFFKHCHFDGIKLLGERIMSVIKDFADAQNAFNDRMDGAVTDLVGDIQNLNDQIAKLIENGSLSEEDKAKLNGLQDRSKVIADKLDALNALTPPVVPV